MFRIELGLFVRKLGRRIQSNYWKCCECGNIEFSEREIICWKCGRGEMIYKGE